MDIESDFYNYSFFTNDNDEFGPVYHSVKLIASDLDGTIIDKNNNISEDNFKAIEEIHNKNICFVICTGKSFAVCKNICSQFNASYGVFGNGTQIIDFKTGQEIYRNLLSKQDLLYAVTFAKRLNLHIHIYTDTEIISEHLMYMDLRNFFKKQDTRSDLKFKLVDNILDYISHNNENVFSAIVSSETSLKEFENLLLTDKNIVSTNVNKRGNYKDCTINKEYEYIHISPKNVDKDIALNFIGDYLKIDKKNMVAVGDNVNDLEMVKNSGFGVAVNDAYNELKNVATYVTKKTVTEGAFAEAVYRVI